MRCMLCVVPYNKYCLCIAAIRTSLIWCTCTHSTRDHKISVWGRCVLFFFSSSFLEYFCVPFRLMILIVMCALGTSAYQPHSISLSLCIWICCVFFLSFILDRWSVGWCGTRSVHLAKVLHMAYAVAVATFHIDNSPKWNGSLFINYLLYGLWNRH